MEEAYNPYDHKQVIVMKNITITTYVYKVFLQIKGKTIHIRKCSPVKK